MLLLVLWQGLSGGGAEAAGSRQEAQLSALQARHAKRHSEFQSGMRDVAAFCREHAFPADAEEIELRSQSFDSGAFDPDELPTAVLPAVSLQLPAIERQWRLRQRKLESDYALDLYRLSREALRQGHPSFAFTLVREVAFHDPDHAVARKLLGYVRDGDQWSTPFARMMSKRGFVDHPQFGWIAQKDVARYETGERFFDGRWISVDRERLLREDFRNAWEVQSEHFEIRTNVSLEKGVELSRKLEEFHQLFLREFTAFFNTPQQMQRLFDDGGAAKESNSRYRLYYFREQREFAEVLRARQPQIDAAVVNGLYMPPDRIAYFYHDSRDEEAALETMFHEVTHQLLGESTPRAVEAGAAANFWMLEGIACYMESYAPDQPEQRLGDPGHIRIFWARRLALEEEHYTPLRRFTALSKANFPLQHEAYSQAAGLCHFFLHYNQGVYRDAFVQHLAQAYHPSERVRLQAPSLEKLTGVLFETLDQQYLQYLETLPSTPPAGVRVTEESAGSR